MVAAVPRIPKKPSGLAYPAIGSALAAAALEEAKKGGGGGGGDGGGGGGDGGGGDGGSHPGLPTDAPAVIVPVPVALNWSTILKLIGPTIALMAAAAGLVLWQWHRVASHIEDGRVHLSPKNGVGWGISRYETRSEARAARKALVHTVKTEVQLKARQQQQEAARQIDGKLDKLQKDQRGRINRVIREVRKLHAH